ncbi:MAG: helix-turn-helix domain-containing protein [Bacteroidales bacterium]|nr:helix-turn-helix domain-containing protein [Bacteroidales bacterium]
MKPNFTLRPLKKDGLIEPHQVKPYTFPHFLLLYLVEGEVLLEVNGKAHLCGPAQLMLVPDNATVVIKHLNECRGFEGSFPLSFVKDASYPALHSKEPILQSFWFDDAVFMGALMKRLLAASSDKDKTFLQSGLDLILSQLRTGGQVAAVPESFLQMVFKKEYATLSVSDYAKKLNVTPNYLNKTVKSHTHRTAIDWIEISRLNLAKMLLKDKSLAIIDVARISGLEDQSYFSRFFKKKTGLTPSQYRNSL